MIRMRHLQALQYVLSSRTLTAGASLFGVTQSGMSRLIAQLEDEVGCRLLVRERGRISLTTEGARFYKEAQAALDAMRRLNLVANELRHQDTGLLRIVSMPGLVNNLIAETVSAFSGAYPKVKVSVAVENRGLLERTIDANNFDVVLVTLPFRAPPMVQVTTLAVRPAVCIVPTKHPLAKRQSIRASDLAKDVPFISFRRGSLLRERVDELFEKLGIERDFAFESHSAELVCEMVAANLGIALIHPFVKIPTTGEFIAKPFRPQILMEYAMLRPRADMTPRHVDIFASMVVAAMSEARRTPRPKRKV